jgi:arylformamidase
MKLIDISVPIREGMFTTPGDPGVRVERARSIERGDEVNVTRLDYGVHSGTHLDAPIHFIEGGDGAEAIPPETLIGPAHVVDATRIARTLDARAIGSLDLPEGATRILFKTRNSLLWKRAGFTVDAVKLNGSGAKALLDAGVRLVGIDYLSIGDHPAHTTLLGAGIVPLEGLNLSGVEPGPYTLIATAMPLVGSDGAGVRALLAPPGASFDEEAA